MTDEEYLDRVVLLALEEAVRGGCTCRPAIEVGLLAQGLPLAVRLVHDGRCPLEPGFQP